MTFQERRRQDRGPKGRGLDDHALADVRALLGSRPRRRDLLIEFLHLIQDEYGCLSAAHLRALAQEMRLSQAEVYEVATFYDHFDVVKEGETPPPPLTIRVCNSVSCMLAGAETLLDALQRSADPASVRVVRAPCMGRCAGAPAARIGDREVDHATVDGLLKWPKKGETGLWCRTIPDLTPIAPEGGYQLLREGAQGRGDGRDADGHHADRRPAWTWRSRLSGRQEMGNRPLLPGPRLMSINGDEGEPGTFKDRIYLEKRSAPYASKGR